MKRVVMLAAACASLAAIAQDAAQWYLQVDNDVVFQTDRGYTSGVRLARVQPYADHAVEFGLQQEVYTPDAKRFSFGSVDRRPAARLLFSAARHDFAARHLQTIELAAGVRGPAAQGESATDLIHRLVPAPDVDWSREGGNRADVLLAAVRTHPLDAWRFHYGVVAGNQVTFAHGGLEWRVGTGAAREIDTPVMRFAATPPLARGRAADAGWSAFLGASVRAVARNELLDEGYDPFAPAPRRRNAVGRLAAGVTASFGWASLAFTLVQDTREFSAQRSPQRFGALGLHVPF